MCHQQIFLSCSLASFLLHIIAVITKTASEMIDGHKTLDRLHPRGNKCWGVSSGFLFVLCLGFVCGFCFLFFLGGITSYETWTVSCRRLILDLVWEWDYCVLPGREGFCLTVADSRTGNSSSLVRTSLFAEKRLRTW